MAAQDYILRLIETMGRVLQEILRGLRSGELSPSEAAEKVRASARDVGLDLDVLTGVDLDTMVRLVSPGGEPEVGRCWIAAELLSAEAYRADLEDDPVTTADRAERALRLYALLDPSLVARGFPETAERVAELRALLAGPEVGE